MDDEGEEGVRDSGSYYFCEDINASFTILSQNIRSVHKNLSKFKQLLQRVPSAKILNFQETWKLNGSESVPGYSKFIAKTRRYRGGGGVAIAIADGVQYKEIDAIFLEDRFESVGVEFSHRGKSYSLFNIYCPPKSLSSDEIVHCMAVLKSKASKSSQVIFLGDFNYDVNKSNDKFIQTILEQRLPPPLFTCPTRVTPTCSSSLDLIFTKIPQIFGGILYSDVSDHYTTFLAFHGKHHSSKISIKPDHSFKALEGLRTCLEKVDFSEVLKDNTITAFDKFDNILYKARDSYCPLKRSKAKTKIYNPWFTKAFLISCKHKDRLHLRAKTRNTPLVWSKFKSYKIVFDRLCRAARLLYFDNQFNSNRNDMKATWKLANSVMGRGNKQSEITTFPGCKSDKDIADTFSKHYSTVASNIANKIKSEKNCPQNAHMKFLPPVKPKSKLIFQSVFPSEIGKILDNMKNKTSYGKDLFSNKVLKFIKEEIKIPVCHLINLSIKLNFIPKSWKIAKVVPIHKGKNRNECVNFRNVSLLSTFSKILERVIAKQVNNYLEKNKILYDMQFGFRRFHRCESLLMKLNDTIFRAKKANKHCVAVMLDISKAFDCVHHQTLLDKLEFWGLPRAWFANYLSGRSQYVNIGNGNSESHEIEYGVPQGSCLAPTLFSLYLTCLPCNISLECLMFADDCSIVGVGKNIKKLFKKVNEELKIIQEYFLANNMLLHPNKTRFMLFHRRSECPDLWLGDQKIKRVGEDTEEPYYKLLGVLIDEECSFRYHINMVHVKAQSSLSLLLRCKRSLPYKMKLLLFNALILSHINYASIIWGAPSSQLDKLEVVVKRGIRAVCNAKYNEHTPQLFKKAGILNLKDTLELNYLKLGNSLYYGQQPGPIQSLFSVASNKRTRAGNKFHFEVPRFGTDRQKSLISYALPMTWNNATNHYSINLQSKLPTMIKNFKKLKLTEYGKSKCEKKHCYVCNKGRK